MKQNTKFVYLVELDYDTTIGIDKMHAHNVIGVFEDKNDAIEVAMSNADSDLTEQDCLDALDAEGIVEIWWHPFKVGDHYATHATATVTEHVLTAKKGS